MKQLASLNSVFALTVGLMSFASGNAGQGRCRRRIPSYYLWDERPKQLQLLYAGPMSSRSQRRRWLMRCKFDGDVRSSARSGGPLTGSRQ